MANFSPASETNLLKTQIGDYMEKDSARAAIQLGLKSLALFEKPSKDLKNIPRNGNGISARAEKRAWTYAVILFSTKQYVSPG